MKLEKRYWLFILRDNRDLTQEEVANSIKISRSTYTKAELGYPISYNTAKKIGDFFSVDWALFFNGREVS